MAHPVIKLLAKYNHIITNLCTELADSESCPFDTPEGCPRPEHPRPERLGSGMCVKQERRSEFGRECWMLWAEKKKGEAE